MCRVMCGSVICVCVVIRVLLCERGLCVSCDVWLCDLCLCCDSCVFVCSVLCVFGSLRYAFLCEDVCVVCERGCVCVWLFEVCT